MKWIILLTITIFTFGLMFIGCDKTNILSGYDTVDEETYELGPLYCAAPPPSPLVTVEAADQQLTLWPYFGNDLYGNPHDPINLIFVGQADPRNLRAALMSLDGDRTAFGFPADFPFNCTWRDCMGDIQSGYAEPDGWTGNTIQLECGDYQQVRFHLRFFKAGEWTIGNCHIEFLIPGTTQHQVLSWELAEQLVTADFVRSGLLDPAMPVIPAIGINDSPWREIPPYIYNELPVELKMLTGGPLGDVSDPVPLWTDGNATILNMAQSMEWTPFEDHQSITIDFNQVVPKPFCNGEGYDYVFVQGPIYMNQISKLSYHGQYSSRFTASGWLDITPVDISTDPPTPLCEPYRAKIRQIQATRLSDRASLAYYFIYQHEIPDEGSYRGYMVSEMRIGPHDNNHYALNVECE
ncbi:MAG: hypothetical protein GY839_03180 [candidate division Zixibacteria bacterium]|nr:hypothetical protein [candidate division Zixibacteria bacterium]